MIEVLYEDDNIIACIKPFGFISEECDDEKISLPFTIKKQQSIDRLYTVHRLDRETEGIIVYAKNKKSAAELSKIIVNNGMSKEYLAAVHSKPEENKGIYTDFLFKDKKTGKSYTVKTERKGVKKAELEYELIKCETVDDKILSLVKVKLITGRTHQIRAQFSSRKMPLVGDRRYGGKDNCRLALFSYKISFNLFGEDMNFKKLPDFDTYPWNLFRGSL